MEPRGDDARYMRRKVKAGLIEADHEECAIVVHYEIEATVLGEAGEPIVAERSENVKVIRLKTLTDSSDIERLAGDILSKCKLIHESKLGRVEDLLRQLQQGQAKARRSVRDGVGGGAISRARQAAQVRALSNSGSSAHVGTPSGSGEVAQLGRLDDYVERMYDGTEAATAATALVLELARVPEQLEALIENETLVGLLVRLLREEGRKSQDLALNCLYVLYAFSSFAQFHPFLVNAGVGSQILQHVGLECKRHEIREKERARDKERAEKPDRDRDKRHKLQTRKQDRLLYVCFHILLHLAEEPEIERKMAKKGLTPLLASILKRDNSELRVLALAFLKKLAVFKENLPALRDASLLAGVAAACGSSSSEELPLTALRVVYNLSFDPHARKAIFASPVLSKLAVLIRRRSHPLVLRILYLLSVEQRGREALAKTDVPVSLRKHVLACSDAQLPAELAGLAINLATASRAADALAAEGGMRHLLERLLQTHDLVLLKLIRALVAHDGPASAAAPLTAELLGLTRQVVDDEHMRLELLGTLSGLRLARLPDLPRLVERYSLIELLRQHMAPGAAQDDALLEAVVLAGELAGSAKVAVMLLSSGLVFRDSMAGGPTTRTLYSLLTERQKDDEFVVQLLFAFYRLLQVEEPRVALLEKTQMVVYLLDLLLDRNSAVCGLASQCLDAISESDEDWAAQIRQRKFEAHNHEWLAVVDEDEAEEYQDALALNNAVKSLRENAPLDASLLGKGGYLEAGETLRPGHSPASDCSSPMDEYGVGHGMHGLGSYGYGLDEYDEEDYVA